MEDLFKPRTLFALLFYVTYCGMIWQKVNPPEGLTNITMMILAFYFGTQLNKER